MFKNIDRSSSAAKRGRPNGPGPAGKRHKGDDDESDAGSDDDDEPGGSKAFIGLDRAVVEDADDGSDEENQADVDLRPNEKKYEVRDEGKPNFHLDLLYKAVHGEEYDETQYNDILRKYTKSDWDALVDTLFNHKLNLACEQVNLCNIFFLFYKLFCFEYKDEKAVVERVSSLYPNITTMKEQLLKVQCVYGLMHTELESRGLLDPETKTGRNYTSMLSQIAFCIKITYEQMVNYRLLRSVNDTTTRSMLEQFSPTFFFKELDIDKMKPNQQLLQHLWRQAFNNDYRKHGDSLYKPRFNSQGDFVHHYEWVCEISDFVYQCIYPLSENNYWFCAMTKQSGTPAFCIQMLTNLKSEWLPTLDCNPNVYSFRDGLFLISLNKFYYFRSKPGRRHVSTLSGNTTACRYLDLPFDDEQMQLEINSATPRSSLNIKMDPIYQILQAQGFDRTEMIWIFALLGRMLFPISARDTWAVFPYFLGMAGTGKSTLLRLVASLFEPRDVGYLNNSLQRTFAVEGIFDKRVYMALDIDEHFQLDQATFQSMVCGEEVSVLRKFKKPLTIVWNIQGGFAGNKLPNWTDNGGSLSRRLIIIEFMQPIAKCDPNLFENCLAIRNRFLKVIVSTYEQMCHSFKDRGIKEVIPEKFKKSEEKALKELNTLSAFVQDCCELDPVTADRAQKTRFQPLAEFKKAFKDYCNNSQLRNPGWANMYVQSVFAKYQLSVVKPGNEDPFQQTEQYVLGAKLKA